jgi:hypothetical protein
MVIKFDITDLEVDLTYPLTHHNTINGWWFRNANIPLDRKLEDLTNEEKVRLVTLAIYENYITIEDILELDDKQFKIKQ